MRLLRLIGALTALVLLVTLSACGGEDDETSDGTESPGQTASARGTVEGEVATAAGLSFEIPEDWESVDPDDVADSTDGAEGMDELADRLGLSAEEFQAQIEGVDLYVFSTETNDGFRDNINVTSPGGSLPDVDQLRDQLTAVGATVGEVVEFDTVAGTTLMADYTLSLPNGTVAGTAVAVEVDSSTVVITVSTTDADLTEEVSDRILGSLDSAA
jgi:hypothetical protein